MADGKHVKHISDDIKDLLQRYTCLTLDVTREKVRCELSGHEMPCSVSIIQGYLNGKKFAKLQRLQCVEDEDIKKHLVPSHKKGREHQLFCLLTLRHLNNRHDHIKKHLDGRRFKRAYKRWQECQKTGEVFRPTGPRGKKHNDSDDMADASKDDEQDGSDHDSLSDLYPVSDIEEEGNEKSKEDSDFEFEDEDVVEDTEDVQGNSDTKHRKKAGSKKRKHEPEQKKKFKKKQKT